MPQVTAETHLPVLGREVRDRIAAFARACEDPAVLAAARPTG